MWEFNESEMFFNQTNGTIHSWMECAIELCYCTGYWPSIAVQLVTYSLILVSSLVGNVLVIGVFFRDKTMRTSVNFFIVNMSLSDLSVSTVSVPVWMFFTVNESLWLEDGMGYTALCKLLWIVWGVSVLVSIFSMTALAADRFRAVIFPTKPALFSQKGSFVAIVAMWISSFALYGYYAIALLPERVSFSSCYEAQWAFKQFVFLLIFFCLICLSVIVITILYLRITIFLYRHRNSLHLADEVVRKRAKRNRKIIIMLIIIVILFYVVWIPFYVMHFLSYFNPNISQPCHFVWLTDYVLPLLHSVINPLIYYIFNKKYRQGFKEILCCMRCFNKESNDNSQPSISSRQENGGQINLAMEIIESCKQ